MYMIHMYVHIKKVYVYIYIYTYVCIYQSLPARYRERFLPPPDPAGIPGCRPGIKGFKPKNDGSGPRSTGFEMVLTAFFNLLRYLTS